MKRIIILICSLTMIFSLVSCNQKPQEPSNTDEQDSEVLLPEIPETSFPYVVDEKFFSIENNENLVIPFELTEDGYFKFIAYDATEYEDYTDEYWDNMPEFQLSFYDEAGNILYENINITEGFLEAYYVEVGKITAEISYSGAVEQMTDIAVSWAFAPEKDEAILAPLNTKVAAKSDESQTAEFSFTAAQDGLYRFSCFEACIWESDCHFTITNVDGTIIANNLFMHGTEWHSRLAFLLKGEYTITVTEIPAVATCLVTLEEGYDEIITSDFNNLTLPATIGLASSTIAPFEIHFTANGENEKLIITPVGINTYYDYEQSYDIVIQNSAGEILLEESVEGNSVWDIAEYDGEYVIKITPYDNGVMKIEME